MVNNARSHSEQLEHCTKGKINSGGVHEILLSHILRAFVEINHVRISGQLDVADMYSTPP